MKKFILNILCLFGLLISCTRIGDQSFIDISGEWTVELDSTGIGEKEGWATLTFSNSINLPGTTDDAGLGMENTLEPKLEKPQLLHLTRKNSYIGAAWYTRKIRIPKNWSKKQLILKLERVIWKTSVWIDGNKVEQNNNSLIAPHYFDLTEYLTPGDTHQITLRIDNRKQFDISYQNLAHAYTNDTQIIWNGVIGKMRIEASDPINISDLQVYPNLDTKSLKVSVEIANTDQERVKGRLKTKVVCKETNKLFETQSQDVYLDSDEQIIDINYFMSDEVKYWSEFSPNLYTCIVELETDSYQSSESVDFGMRSFKANGAAIEVNGTPTFLRGTLECNIFPLTGYPPMEKEGWYKVFNTAKEWGLNHLRFHSWCPPEAAFAVADELGFYLQVELPAWTLTIGTDYQTTDFLYAEAKRIIKEYGNHPSFVMWSMGNELQGDMTVLHKMVDSLKVIDRRHLYSNTAFTFEKGHGDSPEYNDDFFITQWTKNGWVRGQGVFNDYAPSFDNNYELAVRDINVPIITHEIGQYAVYPNIEEIDKYSGVLDPLNFKAVKDDLDKKGLIDKAKEYTLASGKLAALLYKEEIERALKTKGISGFQLLDLHDFPGQGTALVGLLDAFWDNKGIISAEEFRMHSSSIVPLMNFPKATYKNNEMFVGDIGVSNYSGEVLNNQKISWSISDDKKEEKAKGFFYVDLILGYNAGLGKIEYDLSGIKKPVKLTIKIEMENTDFMNQWSVWVYPQYQKLDYGDVFYTNNIEEAFSLLEQGKKVLLNPDWRNISGIEGKFVPVFWSPVHFPKQAGTMGMLTNPDHPALNGFPTDKYTNWQWWDLNINSTTMIVDDVNGGMPIVEMIDNFTNNRKLALIYEGSVGKGKLLFTSIDLKSKPQERFVAQQLLFSLLEYMNSKRFNPKEIINPEVLYDVMSGSTNNKKKSATSIY